MKLKGEFVLREIAGEVILVPVGQTALHFNGIITLNQTGVEIWKGIREEKNREQILEQILEQFEVSRETAQADMETFLQYLNENGLIEQ